MNDVGSRAGFRTHLVDQRRGEILDQRRMRPHEGIPAGITSLDQALEYLDKDREFLTRGGVFSNDFIDAYITLKMEEVDRMRITTHPVEFDMYYSL